MTIRCANINDYQTVAEFSRQIFLNHVENRPDIIKKAPELSKREYKKVLKNKKWVILIAEKNGQPAGHIKALIRHVGDKIWTEKNLIHIHEIYVDPSFRRQGIASGLLDEIKRIASETGTTQITLDVWSFNETAIRLYEKLGYTPQRLKLELNL
ncbi:MAG: GNAT family N-acetyltransferase [Clostridia bacterium]|nr:GNAT family N-acetyltransferase [Clostridia bacterium]MBQ7120881.1 GNAT family N-acetyltransferase [Clostridia bacterium]